MDIRTRSAINNPDADQLRELTAAQPTSQETEYGNLNTTTQVTARSKQSTFIVTVDDDAVLRPRLMYESQDRGTEYSDLVTRLKAERATHLASYEDLLPDIAGAV